MLIVNKLTITLNANGVLVRQEVNMF